MDRRGISRPSLETFLSHSTEKIRSGTLVFQKNSWLKKLHRLVYHNFVENWFSHISEKFRWGTLLFSDIFFYRKFLRIGRGYHDILSKLFCLTVLKKIVGGLFCFRKFLDQKNCIRWCNTILSKNDFLTLAKNFVGRLLPFRKFLVSKHLKDRRGLSFFTVENFLSHSAKKFRRGALLFQKFSGLEKLHKMVYHDFVEKWFSHSTEKFRTGTLCLSESFWYRNIWRKRGGYHLIPSIFILSHSAGNFRKGTILCFRKFLVSKDFMQKRGDHDFVWQFFCLTVPKNFVGRSLCFRKIVAQKNCIRWCITILSEIDFLTAPKKFVGEAFIFQKFSFIEIVYR